jgi:cell division transport system ATP-binding protein
MIQFINVSKNYPEGNGLSEVNIRISDGEFVFLVGPSGAGKTTFIKLILREIVPDEGRILFDDYEVNTLPNRLIPYYRRNIGIVFQDFRLLRRMTVYENVAFAMEAVHQKKKLIKKQVPHILNLVGISEKADHYPEELSGGEAQRVAIARAIVNNPKILIADEPTGNLDPEKSWEIMNLLNQINLRGTTVVMVTHAKDIVDRMEKRVIQIEKGRIVRDDEEGLYIRKRSVDNNLRKAVDADSFEQRVRERRYQQRLKALKNKNKIEIEDENESDAPSLNNSIRQSSSIRHGDDK